MYTRQCRFARSMVSSVFQHFPHIHRKKTFLKTSENMSRLLNSELSEEFPKISEVVNTSRGLYECPFLWSLLVNTTSFEGSVTVLSGNVKTLSRKLIFRICYCVINHHSTDNYSISECLCSDNPVSSHQDNLTAFRLMDRKRKGVVDCQDFKELYNSLGLFCRKGEYQKLLDLIGLHPGGNLNYAEFVNVVENNGKCKQGKQSTCV